VQLDQHVLSHVISRIAKMLNPKIPPSHATVSFAKIVSRSSVDRGLPTSAWVDLQDTLALQMHTTTTSFQRLNAMDAVTLESARSKVIILILLQGGLVATSRTIVTRCINTF